jgi:hypothetical protein
MGFSKLGFLCIGHEMQGMVEQIDFTAIGLQNTGNDTNEGGFAATGGSHQKGQLLGIDAQVNIKQDLNPVFTGIKGFRNPFELNQWSIFQLRFFKRGRFNGHGAIL